MRLVKDAASKFRCVRHGGNWELDGQNFDKTLNHSNWTFGQGGKDKNGVVTSGWGYYEVRQFFPFPLQ